LFPKRCFESQILQASRWLNVWFVQRHEFIEIERAIVERAGKAKPYLRAQFARPVASYIADLGSCVRFIDTVRNRGKNHIVYGRDREARPTNDANIFNPLQKPISCNISKSIRCACRRRCASKFVLRFELNDPLLAPPDVASARFQLVRGVTNCWLKMSMT